MGRLSPAIKTALSAGTRVSKVLRVGFPTAAGGPLYFDAIGRWARAAQDPVTLLYPSIPISPLVTRWESCGVSVSDQVGNMAIPETRVGIADKEPRPLRAILEGAVDVESSPASISWITEGLDEPSWTTLFVGILQSWRYYGVQVELSVKADAHALEFDDVPRVKLTAGDWPLIHVTSKGTFAPIVYGIHDANAITGKGMLPCPNVRFDATAGYWYVVSLGFVKSVDRCYRNGALLTATTQWTWSYVYAGGKPYTIVALVGITPAASDIITVDVKGLTTLAAGTGAVIASPPEILKHALVNFVFNDWQGAVATASGWLADSSAPIDTTSFAAAASWASQFGWESAWRMGGGIQAALGQEVLRSWTNSFPSMRAWWTERGQIGCEPLRHHDDRSGLYPSDPWLREENLIGLPEESFVVSDNPDQLLSRVNGSHLYGEADQKYWATLEVQDPTRPRRGQQSYSLPFSARRVI